MKDRVLEILQSKRSGSSFQELAKHLSLPVKEKRKLRQNLKVLEAQGVIRRIKNTYFLPPRANVIRGRFASTLKGYGFVTPEGESGEDIFIPARYSGGPFTGTWWKSFSGKEEEKGSPKEEFSGSSREDGKKSWPSSGNGTAGLFIYLWIRLILRRAPWPQREVWILNRG